MSSYRCQMRPLRLLFSLPYHSQVYRAIALLLFVRNQFFFKVKARKHWARLKSHVISKATSNAIMRMSPHASMPAVSGGRRRSSVALYDVVREVMQESGDMTREEGNKA